MTRPNLRTCPNLKSKAIKREILHLCRRLLFIAQYRSGKGGRPGKRGALRFAGAGSILGGVYTSLATTALPSETASGRGILPYIFDEKILERGSHRAGSKPAELHPERRVSGFVNSRPEDGPGPMFSLARDDLEHQPHFY